MKILLTALPLCFALSVFAQKDSTHKRDTVYVPMYEKYDTSRMTVLTGKNIVRKKAGYIVIKGFGIVTNGNWQWTTKPELVGYLDKHKRRLKHVIATL